MTKRTPFSVSQFSKEKTYIYQLKLIKTENKHILNAIWDYFEVFKQRSRRIREDLLFVEDLKQYERRLKEERELWFEIMRDEIGDKAVEKNKKNTAKALYK